MLSDDSELTDILSSDDSSGEPPSTKRPSTGKLKKDGYRLRNVLKPGRTTQYTAKALYDQIHQNDIELDPEYQRDVVWSDAKQIGLIDSIFRNFYIPPIIFSVTTEDDGTEKRVCIDGKQRLTSIQKFIGGLIPHRDPFTNEKLWFIDSQSGPKRKLLPPQYKTLFQNKQIVCIEYNDLPQDLEREVFQRVQMGMALTTAEKLQAISGPWPDFVREIMQHYHTGNDGIANNIDIEKTRARDFHNVAQALFCIDHLPGHVQGTPLQIERWLQLEDGPSDEIRTKIHDVFRIFKDLANHKQLKLPLKKPLRVAPVEFIMITVLIALHKNTHTPAQLSQAIGILRAKTRSEHVDVRTNSKVYKTMFSIITRDLKTSSLKTDPGQPAAGSSASITSKSTKRKREEDNDDTSEDIQNSSAKTRISNIQFENGFGPVAKSEDTEANLVPNDRQTDSVHTEPSQGGLARVRAAKQQASDSFTTLLSGSRPPTNSAFTASHNPLPTRPPVTSSTQPNSSLEAMLMSQSSYPTIQPSPYPTPPLNPVPVHTTNSNGAHLPSHIQMPTPTNSHSYQQDTSSTSYPVNDEFCGRGSSRVRDERNNIGYREGEANRSYRSRDWDRDRDRSSRNSYLSHGGPYYKRDWRSGYKDR